MRLTVVWKSQRALYLHDSLNVGQVCTYLVIQMPCVELYISQHKKMSWATTEFESLDLGDPRRNRRAIRPMEKLSAKPTASIPGACGDWADTIGAYRFFRLSGPPYWRPTFKNR